MSGELVLIGGGARSGKSALALRLARARAAEVTFVATAQAFDDEMAARIARHREERDAAFRTVEEPLELGAVLRRETGVVLVDCLTLWLSNLLCRGDTDEAVLAAFDALEDALALRAAPAILVSNEVGLGIVPESALARRFRDLAGALHRRLAARADEVYLAAMGLVLRIKPSALVVEG